MRFIGFRVNLDAVLFVIEERRGRGPSADKLQQELKYVKIALTISIETYKEFLN